MPRRRRRKPGASQERVDPNLTPLLDVVLQLITFFMMLIHFGTKIEGETRAVRLPDGSLGLAGNGPARRSPAGGDRRPGAAPVRGGRGPRRPGGGTLVARSVAETSRGATADRQSRRDLADARRRPRRPRGPLRRRASLAANGSGAWICPFYPDCAAGPAAMSRRPKPPEDVYFPVVPMLDMAFQLLAFFVLTFQVPSRETRIDLDLPAAPVTLPGGPSRRSTPAPLSAEDLGLETNLVDPGGSRPPGGASVLAARRDAPVRSRRPGGPPPPLHGDPRRAEARAGRPDRRRQLALRRGRQAHRRVCVRRRDHDPPGRSRQSPRRGGRLP